MIWYLLLFSVVGASGWWGRYEYPIIAAASADVLYLLTTPYQFPLLDALCVGLVLAYLRRSAYLSRVSNGAKRNVPRID